MSARRNTDIECLRAAAVLAVMLHHMQGGLFHPGLPVFARLFQHVDFWWGVDLFFAISGYIIARNLLPQMAQYNGHWRQQWTIAGAFWIRRAWRLLPSAWLWLGLTMLAVIGYNESGAFGSVHANLMATFAALADVANFRFGDAAFQYEYGATFVYWSLSLEEQFYLLLPLLAMCLRRRVDLFMASLFVIQLFVFRTPMAMALRTDALALGVLLAIAASFRAYHRIKPDWLLRLGFLRSLVPCVGLVLCCMLSSIDFQAWPWRISAIAIIAVTLVWIASHDLDFVLQEGRIKRLLTWIGGRSYAIYLIHIPVYFALRETAFRLGSDISTPTPVHAVALMLLATALVLGLAHLNYCYVEQPLRRRGRGIADRFLQRHGCSETADEASHSNAQPGALASQQA